MFMQWTEELATGIAEIDSQHKEIFKRIEKLADACRAGKGKDEIEEIFLFLNDYVMAHFGMEEEMMQKLGYPDYPFHKVQHRKFVQNYLEMKGALEEKGVSSDLAIKANVLLMDWLAVHIRNYDKSMGVFLRGKLRPR
jgi:hemerythrin